MGKNKRKPGRVTRPEDGFESLTLGGQGFIAVGSDESGQNSHLNLDLYRVICGPVVLPVSPENIETVPGLTMRDSLVSSGIEARSGFPAVVAAGSAVNLENCTILGTLAARRLEASNVIFNGTVRVVQHQNGCVRFSFVPEGSETPRRYRCQPELEIAEQAERAAKLKNIKLTQPEVDAISTEVRQWLVPSFTTLDYFQPAYAQLSLACPVQLRTGADNGSEMGGFNFLLQPQREANLLASLDEYLRFGLEAGIFYVS